MCPDGSLHPLLEGIIGNFEERYPCDAALLEMIIALDGAFTGNGCPSSDFVVLVGRKKKAVPSTVEAPGTGREKMDTVYRQEEEMLELNRRLQEVWRLIMEPGEAEKERTLELEALRCDREMPADENESLKSQGPLRTL